MNETIELPWVMRSYFFYRFIGITITFIFFSMDLDSFFEKRILTFMYLVPIAIGFLTWFGSIRSVRCSEEEITKTYGFIWSESVSWENVQEAQIGQAIETIRYGSKLPPYYYLSLRTKSYKNFEIILHWFPQKDIEILIKILRSKPFPFSINVPKTTSP